MSIHKNILLISSAIFITLILNTHKVLADSNINLNTKFDITKASMPIGGFSLVLENYYNVALTENGTDSKTIKPMSIEESVDNYIELKVPKNNSFKSYMSYKAITNKSSKQYELQQLATTNNDGIREIDGRLCIALGTYYGSVGDKIDVVMENGNILECIISDLKDDKHTNSTNQKHKVDGSVVEFVVDIKNLNKISKLMGDISYTRENFEGEISYIKKYK